MVGGIGRRVVIVGASGYLFHQFREVTKMVTKQKELVFYQDRWHPYYDTIYGLLRVWYTEDKKLFCYALAAPIMLEGEWRAECLRRRAAYRPEKPMFDCLYLRSLLSPGVRHLRSVTKADVGIAMEYELGVLTRVAVLK